MTNMPTDDYNLSDEYENNKIEDLIDNYEDHRKDIENVKSHLIITRKRVCVVVGVVIFVILCFVAFLAYAFWATVASYRHLDRFENEFLKINEKLSDIQENKITKIVHRLTKLENRVTKVEKIFKFYDLDTGSEADHD